MRDGRFLDFLAPLLGRPQNERHYVLFPVGFAADEARVPDLRRKSLDEITLFDPLAISTS